MDGSVLLKPQTPSMSEWIVIGVLAVVGIVAGAVLLSWFFDSVLNAAAREQASLEENLTREVSLDLPSVASLLDMDDASIEQSLSEQGYETYVLSSSTEDPDESLDIMKLPNDVSAADAAVMYASGISSLSASNAVLLLNGSWRLDITRESSTSARVRYADFTSSSLDEAISAAIASQGFTEESVTDSGTDSSGNRFREGTVETDSGTATWRVSAIDLSTVYSIDGLPSDAWYVGIRVTR